MLNHVVKYNRAIKLSLNGGKMETLDFNTPVGKIVYMNLTKPDKNGTFKLCLSFKLGDEGVQGLLDTVAAINPKKIVDTKTNSHVPDGHVQIIFKSKYAPNVLQSNGSEYAEGTVPTFAFETDSGKAIVRAKISTKGKTPTFYMQDVRLLDLDIKERTAGTANSNSIRGELQAIHNG